MVLPCLDTMQKNIKRAYFRKRQRKPTNEDGQMELRSMMDRERETVGVQGVRDVVTCHTELQGVTCHTELQGVTCHTELNGHNQEVILDTQAKQCVDVAL